MRALDRLIAGEKHFRLLGASSPIDQMRRSGIFGLLGGARGPFLAAAAMVMKTSFFASGQICPFGLSFPSLFQNRGKFAPNFSPLIYNSINILKKLVIPSNLLV